jgi:hypothetical protein
MDGMIVIAAVAVALAFESSAAAPSFVRPWDLILFRMLRFLVELLVTCSFAVLLFWSSRRRPTWREFSRTPGLVASGIAAAGSFLAICLFALFGDPGGAYELAEVFWFVLWLLGGIAVAAGWLILAWAGQWKRASSGIDRCGRILGVLWMSGVGLFLLAVDLAR